MFARTIVALFVAVAALSVSAAPIAGRQIGNIACNLERVEIVANLKSAQSKLKDLALAMGDDAKAAAAIKSTSTSITAAQDAIGVIGKAVITLQKAPPSARITVQSSLLVANGTFAAVASTDPATQTLIAQTQAAIIAGIGAGDSVVSTCK